MLVHQTHFLRLTPLFTKTHSHSWVESSTLRVKCFVQEYNTFTQPSLKAKPLDPAQVKCQAGYGQDPGNPTQDPRWEWRDPALGGGIPPFPPGMKI